MICRSLHLVHSGAAPTYPMSARVGSADVLRPHAPMFVLRSVRFPAPSRLRGGGVVFTYWSSVMATGKVKWFNAQKGYGFIQPTTGGADVFVHITAVERAGMDGLQEGQTLSYELEQGQRGRVSAVNLKSA